MDGERGCVDFRRDGRFLAEMQKVGGEAVADIDHGVDEGAKTATEGETRLGIEVGVVAGSWVRGGAGEARSAGEGEEFGGGSAEDAGDVEEVAGLRGGAEARGVARKLAEGDDVGGDRAGRLRGVASGEGDAMLAGEGEETFEESVEPGAGQARGEREGEEDSERLGAHGGEIAEAAGEAAMSGGLRRVPVAAEVDALEREVGGDAEVVAGAGAEDSAVVADAESERAGSGVRRGLAADGLDEGELGGDRRYAWIARSLHGSEDTFSRQSAVDTLAVR